jgi:hypothetical protein
MPSPTSTDSGLDYSIRLNAGRTNYHPGISTANASHFDSVKIGVKSPPGDTGCVKTNSTFSLCHTTADDPVAGPGALTAYFASSRHFQSLLMKHNHKQTHSTDKPKKP